MILRTDSIKCVLDCQQITDEDIFTLFTEGDVLFSESETQADPKKYVLEGNRISNGHSFKIKFTVRDSTSEIYEVLTDDKCDCKGIDNKNLHLVKMPDEMVKKVLQQKDLSVNSEVKCKIDCFGLKDMEVYDLIGKGTIDNEMSTPRSFPYPIYFIRSGAYLLKMEIFSNCGPHRRRSCPAE